MASSAPSGSGPWLFTTTDPQGRSVGLTRRTFEDHICRFHPGLGVDSIKAAVEQPDAIAENAEHGSLNYVVSVPGRRGFFRLVAARARVERDEPRYAVCTAYPKSIPPTGRVIWQRPTIP